MLAAERTGEWEARTGSPLAAYLIGRSLAGRAWYEHAARYFDRAIAAGAALPPRIAREAVRQRAVVACATGDAASVARVRADIARVDGPFAAGAGRRDGTLRLLDRCSVSSSPRPRP